MAANDPVNTASEIGGQMEGFFYEAQAKFQFHEKINNA
jgi:hypothetical protein